MQINHYETLSVTELDINNEDTEINSLTDLPQNAIPENTTKNADVFAMNSIIEKFEARFALKLSSKDLLARQVVNDVFAFCSDVHSMKLELISTKLKEKFFFHFR